MSKYEEVVNRLVNQDWSFEYSDDPRAYKKGRNSLEQLMLSVITLPAQDATILWDQYAGSDYKDKLEMLSNAVKRKYKLS